MPRTLVLSPVTELVNVSHESDKANGALRNGYELSWLLWSSWGRWMYTIENPTFLSPAQQMPCLVLLPVLQLRNENSCGFFPL
ncbi:hypothetical protein I7I50_03039 [Histoplasma capsulatum G186AR]|uniref:Uncharacterized protein n=1 Tax=Ajellomyces capsulatus TaxID=5037 RepID=A0A8H7Z5P3_AJECA|nr:hypothetical protein I7I52_00295 [Histoplasma capsulatum]QSS71997.1 hypothetical protein I7I50_03039 [Histoplasma capsulatum G186AR]